MSSDSDEIVKFNYILPNDQGAVPRYRYRGKVYTTLSAAQSAQADFNSPTSDFIDNVNDWNKILVPDTATPANTSTVPTYVNPVSINPGATNSSQNPTYVNPVSINPGAATTKSYTPEELSALNRGLTEPSKVYTPEELSALNAGLSESGSAIYTPDQLAALNAGLTEPGDISGPSSRGSGGPGGTSSVSHAEPINFTPNNVTTTASEAAAQHLANGGTQEELDQIAAIYNSGDPVMIDNWEKFSSTGKYAPGTAWRATYDEAIAGGNTHEDARAWADGVHKDNPNAANLPVPAAASGTPVVTPTTDQVTASGLTPEQYKEFQAIFKQYTGSEADADDLKIHGPAIASGESSLDRLKVLVINSDEAKQYRTSVINQTFNEIVGRPPTMEDMNLWQERLAGGETVESFRELAKINAANDKLAQSGGDAVPPVMSVPVAPPVSPNRDAIKKIFEQYVGRTATDADLAIHEPRIDNQGVSLDQLKSEVANSGEAAGFRDNTIKASFLQYVGREAQPGDYDIWRENLKNGSWTKTSFESALYDSGEGQNLRAAMNITDSQGVTKNIYDLPVNDRNAAFNHIQNGGTFQQLSNLGVVVGYGGGTSEPSTSYPSGGGYMTSSDGSSPVPPLPAAGTNPNAGFSPFA